MRTELTQKNIETMLTLTRSEIDLAMADRNQDKLRDLFALEERLNALQPAGDATPKPRKPRSDRGTKRTGLPKNDEAAQ